MLNPETDHYPSVDTPDEREACPYCEAREDEAHDEHCALAYVPRLPELILEAANVARMQGREALASDLMALMTRAA